MKYIKRLTTPRAYSRYISSDWLSTVVPIATEEQLLAGESPSVEEISQAIEAQDIAFSIEMNTSGNFLTFKMTNTTENKVVYNFKVDVSTFFDKYAQTLWIVKDEFMDEFMWKSEETTLNSEHFYESFSQTYVSKSSTAWTNKTLFGLYVRAEGDNVNMEDVDVLLIHPRSVNYVAPAGREIEPRWAFDDPLVTKDHDVTITGNVELKQEWLPLTVVPKLHLPIIDGIQLSSTRVDDTFTINVTTYPKVSYVYVTSNAGILPKTKVAIDETGQGSFKVLTTGLDTGDEIIVKVGYRSLTNIGNLTLTV